MLMLGLNSDSYCTQRAATAASCINNKKENYLLMAWYFTNLLQLMLILFILITFEKCGFLYHK